MLSNNFWPNHRSCGDNNVPLNINECCLDIASQFPTPVSFYVKNVECLDCNYRFQSAVALPEQTTSYVLNVEYPVEFYVENGGEKLCSHIFYFENLGRYLWNISKTSCGEIQVLDRGEQLWLNVAVIVSVFVGIISAYGLYMLVLASGCFRSFRRRAPFHELEVDLGNPNIGRHNYQSYIQARTRRQSRIASVDVFRGIAISLMIFVNYGGGAYRFFKHSVWNGLTVADLVFPWFIWIMGVSIALSLRSKLRTSVSRRKIFAQIFKRTLLLIVLGLILNSRKNISSHSDLDSFTTLRLPGVLQRIGVTYFIVASTELFFIKPQRNEQFGPWYFCPEIVDSIWQWIIAIFLVIAHGLITFMLPVPGCPNGYLGPGGWHAHSAFENCTGGAAGFIDRLLLTESHLYQHPTFHKVYNTHIPYDPEGLLGTLTSVFCAFLGVHVGRIILCYENTQSRIRRWVILGNLLGLIAGFLCNFSENDGFIPINKNLWSISYVLATSSLAFIIFSFLYWLIDYKRLCVGSPFLYAGMNALFLYIGHEILKYCLPWYWRPFTETHIELLAMNLMATCLWLYLSYELYKRNIFITI